MNRQDRLAIMAAIIYASRTIAMHHEQPPSGWEKSPADVADMLDGMVQHLLQTPCDPEQEPMTPGHPISCDCHDCVQARVEAAG